MTDTPFAATVRRMNQSGMTFSEMDWKSDRARSQAWWNNLANYGAWRPTGQRVGPPPPEAIDGIAKLFNVTQQEVRQMIATDWYEVIPPAEVSQRVRGLETAIDALSEADLSMVEALLRRLAFGDQSEGKA